MPVSPSAKFRQGLPSHKRTLNSRAAAARDLLASPPLSSDPDLSTYLRKLNIAQAQIQLSVDNLQALDKDWHVMLETLTDDRIITDEQTHQENAALAEPDGYLGLIANAGDLICELGTTIQALSGPFAPGQQNLPHSASNSRENDSVPSFKPIQIPKLKLPTFDGNILKWKGFFSIFAAAIHDRHDLSDSAKFSYLIPQLTGDAKDAIDGLLVSDDNYHVALEILKQRFDRSDDRLVSMLYGQLKRVPRCGKSREDKRRTLDKCERIFRQLEQIGEDVESNRATTFDLLSKFPSGMVRDLQRYYSVGVHSRLSELRDALEQSISELEQTYSVLGDLEAVTNEREDRREKGPSTRPVSDSRYRKPSEGGSSRSSGSTWTPRQGNHSTFAALTKKPDTPCYFCGESHFNARCVEFPSAKSRLDRLRELGRCARCARAHDGGKDGSKCQLSTFCRFCHSNMHYSPLCHNRFPDVRSESGQSKDLKSGIATKKPAAPKPSNSGTDSGKPSTAGGRMAFLASARHNSLFQTAKVRAVNLDSGQSCVVRVALDTLSTSSYIVASKASEMALTDGRSDKMFVKIFGTKKSAEVSTREVQFGLTRSDGSILEIDAYTIDYITDCDVLPTNWPDREKQILDSLKAGGTLADDPDDADKTIDVLIGADYVWDIVKGTKIGTDSSVALIPSIFGLMLSGRVYMEDTGYRDGGSTLLCLTQSHCVFPHSVGLVAAKTQFKPVYPDIDEYWKLETIGISDCPIEDEDEKAMDRFNETVAFEKGRYHVTWPWIPEKQALLPSNYNVALRRFKSLTTRLQSDEKLLSGYRDIIAQQVERGIIEKVPVSLDQSKHAETTVHYLPHHPVVKLSSATTKIRIVYDASSRQHKSDVSLNDCVLRGPVILPDLCQILMRFRTQQTVVISDIEKAFLQVALQISERDVTRFLWYEDDSVPTVTPSNLACYRFCRVAFGIKSSPFLLGATIQHHLTVENTEFASKLSKDIYVDNVISGTDDLDPIQYYKLTKEVFARAGMNLQEFCSNSRALMDYLPDVDRVKNPDTKVLGMRWDSLGDDTIRLPSSAKWSSSSNNTTVSKRTVLQAIASVFDPLGLFQPVLFPAKLFLQRLWVNNLEWDAPLAADLLTEWLQHGLAIQPIFEIRVPRLIGRSSDAFEIVMFSDASAKGYGCTAYVRSPNHHDGWSCHLLFAKSRLTPTPKRRKKSKTPQPSITLPRLELLGATIAASAGEFCRNAFGKSDVKIHFFIDSECVLHWIRSGHTLKRFVARRIERIRAVENCEFHYVRTDDNPSDYLTRGKTADELAPDSLWWNGPNWLRLDRSEWPETRLGSISDEALNEICTNSVPVSLCHAAPTAPGVRSSLGPLGINPDRFHSLNQLIRTTCIAMKYLKVSIFANLSPARQASFDFLRRISPDPTVTADDFRVALDLWIKHVQQSCFSDEIEALSNRRKSGLVFQLGLKLDQHDLLRSHGRYTHSDLPDETRFPLLLPKDHPLSALVVLDVHAKLRHSGISHTLSEVRRLYWIPSGRAFVRKMLNRCIVCKKTKTAVPLCLPDMPALPFERICQSAPFQHTGLDYFGPFKVKVHDSVEKMWCCLFTCLATRAVHLEIVMDCTVTEFFNCLVRFVSRRGCPQYVISDNAGQFRLTKILADRAWKRCPTDPNILSYSAQSGLSWKFIIELAPWQGGHYERLVGVVKSVLKTAIGRRLLTWTDMVTLLAETEAIVNSRPITYVDSDADAAFHVLRPVDFFINRPISTPFSADSFPVRDLGNSGKRLASIWKQRERYLNAVWKNWYDQYVLSLRERSCSSHPHQRGSLTRVPREGEVVLLRDDDVPRGSWKLARVAHPIRSVDGQVRAAEIVLPNGYHVRRALNFLLPLEVQDAVAPPDLPNTVPTVDRNPAVSGSDDDIDFPGFSGVDIQRTIDALHLIPRSGDAESDAEGATSSDVE